MAEGKVPPVLLIGPSPPPFGGMAVQGQLLLAKLREEGVSVEFLATNPPLGGMAKVPLIRTLASGLVFGLKLLGAMPRARVVHILGASGFYFFARVLPAILWARRWRRRAILNYRGGPAEGFFRRAGVLADLVVRRASLLTVPSAFLARVFAARGHASSIVPNITDLTRFPFQPRATIRPQILVNRNFESMYNVGLALETFARLRSRYPGATLTLAGTGPEESNLRATAARLGLSDIQWAGRVDNVQMAVLYSQHDIYLNPTNADNMPISILESLASGLVVVPTTAGATPVLAAAQREPLLVPPNDAPALEAAIVKVLESPCLAAGLIERGRALTESFRWEEVRKILFAAYRGEPMPSSP